MGLWRYGVPPPGRESPESLLTGRNTTLSTSLFLPVPSSGMYQTRFGGPEAAPEDQGDCWATAVACYASLDSAARDELNGRIVESDYDRDGTPLDWWGVTARFLRERDLPELTVVTGGLKPDLIYLASGPSSRIEGDHVVLAYGDGTLFWDPHPSGDGVVEIKEWICWWRPE